jgi:superfamily II DNA or RNA helicase
MSASLSSTLSATSALTADAIVVPVLTLRDYQTADITRLRNAYSWDNRAVVYQLATGGGKTVVFSHIVAGAVAKGRRVGVFVHRRELVKQASDKLTWAGVAHGVIAAGLERDVDAPVIVCSIQTVAARGIACVGHLDFIVIDEAHHARAATWTALLEAFPTAKVLGVTATPARTDGLGLGKAHGGLFDAMVCGPTMSTLVEAGHLAPCKVYVPSRRIDTSGLRKVGGDWAAGDEMARRASVVTGDAIAEYRSKAEGRSAIAFCVTIAHAEEVAAQFRAAGYRAACVHGGTPKDERDAAIAALGADRLGANALDILTSCDLISEGLDVPSVGAVILLRPTGSLILCLQQIGRGMRPKLDGSPLIVLDHAGNTDRHGLPEDDRLWTLDGVTKVAAPRKPPNPETVGFGVPREVEQVAGELVEATSKAARDARWSRMTYNQFKSVWRTEAQAREFGAVKGYKKGFAWAFIQSQPERFGR